MRSGPLASFRDTAAIASERAKCLAQGLRKMREADNIPSEALSSVIPTLSKNDLAALRPIPTAPDALQQLKVILCRLPLPTRSIG